MEPDIGDGTDDARLHEPHWTSRNAMYNIKGGTHPNRWVERTLLLRQTCRQLGQSTFGVLVDAMTSSFQGRQPDLTWLY